MSNPDPSNEPYLEGVTVLDFSQYLAGPACTRLLTELGADVIKVELPPYGDPQRSGVPRRNKRSGGFIQQNRGKRSICVDLARPEGVALIRELVPHVDVVVENFSAGVMDRRGLGYDDLAAINPRVIMASISGFGQTGPLSHKTAFDFIAQAYSGLMHLTGEPDGPPTFTGIALGDNNAGFHAFAGIGYALYRRDRTGRGSHLDISMVEALFHMQETAVHAASMDPTYEARREGRHYGPLSPAGVFKGPEGWIVILCTQNQIESLWAAMGRPELADDPRFGPPLARIEHRDTLTAEIEEWLQSFPTDADALAVLEANRVPCSPVLDPTTAADEPFFIERGAVRTVDDPLVGEIMVPGFPLKFSDAPPAPDLVTHALGQDNATCCGICSATTTPGSSRCGPRESSPPRPTERRPPALPAPPRPRLRPVDRSYVARVAEVMDHVRHHLDGDLSLDALARVANFSPYHFHRIFGAVTGETVASFTRRARLERAVRLMRAAPGRSLSSISGEVGFATPSDFARVFKAAHGCAPSAWDRVSLLNDSLVEPAVVDRPPTGEEAVLMERSACRLIGVRVADPWRGDHLDAGYQRLIRWLSSRGVDWASCPLVGLSWESPTTTPMDRLVYDLGFVVGPELEAEGEFVVHELAAMRTVEVHGRTLPEVAAAWAYLYGTWLPASAHEPDDVPALKWFRTTPQGLGPQGVGRRLRHRPAPPTSLSALVGGPPVGGARRPSTARSQQPPGREPGVSPLHDQHRAHPRLPVGRHPRQPRCRSRRHLPPPRCRGRRSPDVGRGGRCVPRRPAAGGRPPVKACRCRRRCRT